MTLFVWMFVWLDVCLLNMEMFVGFLRMFVLSENAISSAAVAHFFSLFLFWKTMLNK